MKKTTPSINIPHFFRKSKPKWPQVEIFLKYELMALISLDSKKYQLKSVIEKFNFWEWFLNNKAPDA